MTSNTMCAEVINEGLFLCGKLIVFTVLFGFCDNIYRALSDLA